MDKKFKAKIIIALRRLTFQWPAINEAKKLKKVAPATFECEHCKSYCYEGKKSLPVLQQSSEYIELFKICKSKQIEFKFEKVDVDHKEPIVPINGFGVKEWDWDQYVNRLFCDVSNFQILCETCHTVKSNKERQARKEVKDDKKKTHK